MLHSQFTHHPRMHCPDSLPEPQIEHNVTLTVHPPPKDGLPRLIPRPVDRTEKCDTHSSPTTRGCTLQTHSQTCIYTEHRNVTLTAHPPEGVITGLTPRSTDGTQEYCTHSSSTTQGCTHQTYSLTCVKLVPTNANMLD